MSDMDLSNVPLDEQPEEWRKVDKRLLTRMGHRNVRVSRGDILSGFPPHVIEVPSPSRSWEGFGMLWEWCMKEWLMILVEHEGMSSKATIYKARKVGPPYELVTTEHADPRAALALAVDQLPMEGG